MGNPQIGNMVLLQIDDNDYYYQIYSKQDNVYFIVDPNNKSIKGGMYFNPENKSWQISGLGKPHTVKILTNEQYNQMTFLLSLPFDILYEVAVKLSSSDILNLCLTSKTLNERICSNENFWQRKYINDFGIPDEINPMGWKYMYINSNKVYSFGYNCCGQLGLGDEVIRDKPTQILGTTEGLRGFSGKAKYVASGLNHAIIIDMENDVYSFGFNLFGSLGLGDRGNKSKPTQIPGIKAKYAAAGFFHTIIIDMDNNVWSFGNNEHGELGLGDEVNRNKPTQILGATEGLCGFSGKAKHVAAGENHTIIIDMENNVWSFGFDLFGPLAPRYNIDNPTQIPKIKAKYAAIGRSHAIMIDMKNDIWGFGSNNNGQLGQFGLGGIINKLIQIPGMKAKYIASGANHTLIIDMENNVYSFGSNIFGQLGLNNKIYMNSLSRIPGIKAKYVATKGNSSYLISY